MGEWLQALDAFSQTFIIFLGKEVVFSTLIFVAVAGITLGLRRRSPRLHLLLWGLVLLRLVLPTDFSWSLSARAFLERAEILQPEIVKSQLVKSTDGTHTSEASQGTLVMNPDFHGSDTELSPSSEAVFRSIPTRSEFRLPISLFTFLLGVWLIGFSFLGALFTRRLVRYYKIARTAHQ